MFAWSDTAVNGIESGEKQTSQQRANPIPAYDLDSVVFLETAVGDKG